MINWKKTKENYNYGESDLPKTSTRPVVWECENPDCDAPRSHKTRVFPFVYANKKAKKANEENKSQLCQTCSHRHRRGKIAKKTKNSAMPLPIQVSNEKTYDYYGYKASDLPAWSRKRVVLDCDCGNECETSRAQLNKYKSVKITGEFKCIACWTKDRRLGVKVSDSTKQLQKMSQKKRRERELQLKNKEQDKMRKEIKEEFDKLNQSRLGSTQTHPLS